MSERFPFNVSDITGWIIKRKDGILVKYSVVSAKTVAGESKKETTAPYVSSGLSWLSGKVKSYGEWCDHTPSTENPPIFEASNIGLYIADAVGARKSYDQFDVAIDGGGVLSVPGEHDLPFIFGDPVFQRLSRFVNKTYYQAKSSCRILKIRWMDRAAPPLSPAFWPALLEQLKVLQEEKGSRLNVLTICQGGHGRSGSALASLMMCLSDYSPLDALTHIRALHCSRAIESKEQHEYLNEVGKILGREPDALDAEHVASFKDRFLAEERFDQEYKDRVAAGKGAVKDRREAGYL